MQTLTDLAERGWVPEPLVRAGIRHLLRGRLATERARHADPELQLARFIAGMGASEIAPVPHLANEQHYAVPPGFFEVVLGRHLKYSSCLWEPGTETLDDAEAAMLGLTALRAGIEDGQQVLDLGCGWGSFTLWAAARFPRVQLTSVSNSAAQGAFIRARAAERGLSNVRVITDDVNRFDPGRRFDRIVSVEMFEHVRNWPALLRRVHGWLEPGGRLFTHVFAHRRFAYPFEIDGDGDWMARNFFTGGIMPSHDLFSRVGSPFEVESRWLVNGTHYARTAEAWLDRLDAGWDRAVAALAGGGLSQEDARLQAGRWRIFFLACAELFGYEGGEEWVVSHNLLRPAGGSP